VFRNMLTSDDSLYQYLQIKSLIENKWSEKTGCHLNLMQLSAWNCSQHIQKMIGTPEFLQDAKECQALKRKQQIDFHLSLLERPSDASLYECMQIKSQIKK